MASIIVTIDTVKLYRGQLWRSLMCHPFQEGFNGQGLILYDIANINITKHLGPGESLTNRVCCINEPNTLNNDDKTPNLRSIEIDNHLKKFNRSN